MEWMQETQCLCPGPCQAAWWWGAVMLLQRQPEGLWEDVRNRRLATGKALLGRGVLPKMCERRLGSYVSIEFGAPTAEPGPVLNVTKYRRGGASGQGGTGRQASHSGACARGPVL